jgi:hypothetical protein
MLVAINIHDIKQNKYDSADYTYAYIHILFHSHIKYDIVI